MMVDTCIVLDDSSNEVVVTNISIVESTSAMVDTGNASVDTTIAPDDSNILTVVTGIAAVDETDALHDDGNGAVETSIAANGSSIGVVDYLIVLYVTKNNGPLWVKVLDFI